MPLSNEPDPLSAYEPSPFDGNQRRGEVVDMLEGKVGKKEANYINPDRRKEEGQEDEIGAACRDCGNYLDFGEPTSKCAVVIGTVDEAGVCDMFDPSIGGQALEAAPIMQ